MFMRKKWITYGLSLIIGLGVYGSGAGHAVAAQDGTDVSPEGYTHLFEAPALTEKGVYLAQELTLSYATQTSENNFVVQIQSKPVALSVYKALEAHIEDLKTGTRTIPFAVMVSSGYDVSKFKMDLQTGIEAFNRDYSEVFWIDITKLAFYYDFPVSGGKASGNIRLAPGYKNYFSSDYRSQAEVERDIQLVNKTIATLVAKAKVLPNDYARVKLFHDYIVEKNSYNTQLFSDRASTKAWEITSALYYGSTNASNVHNPVCEGYARALKVLCDYVGIPNVLVTGDADGERHMWNYVQLDGKWYAVDATWNDPIYSFNPSATTILANQYQYFLKGSADFKNHTSDGRVQLGGYTFSYPTLSVTNYNPSMASVQKQSLDRQQNDTPSGRAVVKAPTTAKAITVGYNRLKTIHIDNLQKDAKVTYKSSNKKAVLVFSKGEIVGMEKGKKATITIDVIQGGKKFKLQTVVTCKS